MKARTTLDEFYRMFPTERRCWEVLRRVRWLWVLIFGPPRNCWPFLVPATALPTVYDTPT